MNHDKNNLLAKQKESEEISVEEEQLLNDAHTLQKENKLQILHTLADILCEAPITLPC